MGVCSNITRPAMSQRYSARTRTAPTHPLHTHCGQHTHCTHAPSPEGRVHRDSFFLL